MGVEPRRIRRCVRVFFAWQEGAEERWLERMAAEGWFLVRVTWPVYTFVQAAPARLAYRLDYRVGSNEDLDTYLGLYRDAGWEFVARLGSWMYFRRPATGTDADELYTDNRSRAQRYRRQLTYMLIAALPVLSLTATLFQRVDGWWADVIKGGLLVLLLALVYGMGRIAGTIRRLESDPRE